MKKSFYYLTIVFLIVAASTGHANENCPDAAYKAIGSFLKKDDFFPKNGDSAIVGNVVTSACKQWPYKKDTLLVAFAYDEGVEDEKTVVVAILNNSMNVTSHYIEKTFEGASHTYGPDSLILDTARYDLSPGVRAFGLRFNSFGPGPSAANGYHGDHLTLFVPVNKTLRPVFTEYMTYSNALTGRIGYPTGHEFLESGIKTISIAKTSTNGFADLIVEDTITYEGDEEDRPADKKTDKRIEKRIYKYDGTRYK